MLFRFQVYIQIELFEVQNSKNFLGSGVTEPSPQTPPPALSRASPSIRASPDSDPPNLLKRGCAPDSQITTYDNIRNQSLDGSTILIIIIIIIIIIKLLLSYGRAITKVFGPLQHKKKSFESFPETGQSECSVLHVSRQLVPCGWTRGEKSTADQLFLFESEEQVCHRW